MVVALGLMALILLLLMGLASLVQVEARRGGDELQAFAARQNALLGLRVALATLQTEAGPDQRVTARADILTVDRTDPDNGVAAGKGKWTGVWRVDSSGDLSDQARWLVSHGRQDDDAELQLPQLEWDAGVERVRLVGEGTAPTGVWVESLPVVELGREAGRVAWWVGDEGIKAKISVVNPPGDGTRFTQVPRRFGLEKVEGLESFEQQLLGAGDWLERVVSGDQLALGLGSDGAEQSALSSTLRQRFFDLTPWSWGVLADTRDGGLRVDLTAGLEQQQRIEDGEGELVPLWRTVADGFQLEGPTWERIRGWYQLRDQITFSGEDPVNARIEPVVEWVLQGHSELQFITPLVLYSGQTWGLELLPEGDYYRLHATMKPVVALWNPYDVVLEAADYTLLGPLGTGSPIRPPGFWIARFDPEISGANKLYDYLYVTVSDHLDTRPESGDDANTGASRRNQWTIRFQLDSVELDPGEIRWFSLPGSGRSSYSVPERNDRGPVLEPGFRPQPWLSIPLVRFGNDHLPEWSEDEVRNIVNTDHHAALSDEYHSPELGLMTAAQVDSWYFQLRTRGTQFTHHLLHGSQPRPSGTTNPDSVHTWRTSTPSPSSIDIDFIDAVGGPPLDAVSVGQYLITPGKLRAGNLPGARLLVQGNVRSRSQTHIGESHAHEQGFQPFGGAGALSGVDSDQGIHFSAAELWQSSGMVAADPSEGRAYGPVLFHVPREPVFSLAQLQHVDLSNNSFGQTYAVGNSVMSPFIAPDRTIRTVLNLSNLSLRNWVRDDSWLANDALFDRYFFSTWNPDAWQAAPLNPRLVAFRASPVIDPEASEGGIFIDPAAYTNAANLLVDGPFNVNSTSVEAWKAILGSMNQSLVRLRNPETGVVSSEPVAVKSTFFRLPHPAGSSPGDATQNRWLGMPELSDQQLRDLAGQIVYRLRARGRPYGSLAEFINRDLVDFTTEDYDDPALRGLLQRALDAVATVELDADADLRFGGLGINPRLGDGSEFAAYPIDLGEAPVRDGGRRDWYRPATRGLAGDIAPGYTMQADLLTPLAPILSARSDTFIIRAYGEIREPATGSVVARSWCEAVVQRMPDYVDAAIPPHLSPLQPDAFGRRFRILSFRWLNPDEV